MKASWFAAAWSLMIPTMAFAQHGSIQGQVVLDGEIPKAAPLLRAAAICGPGNVPDERIVVDAVTKGVANVVVYLRRKPDAAKIPAKLATAPETVLQFDQVGCRFVPHVLVVRAGQTVKVLNGDGVPHNTRNAPVKNPGFNFIVPAKDREGIPVANQTLGETVPVPISCDIHPWMRGYWVMVDHPYAVVTGADGKFQIDDLPEGEHEFRVWHEVPGYIEKSLKVNVVKDQLTEIPVINTRL